MKYRTPVPTFTRLCQLTVMIAALLLLVTPGVAQNNCLQDEYSLQQSQNLNCTANDVRVAKVSNVRDLSGNPLTTCIQGTTFSFIADFEIVTSSTSSRSNIGLYFATQNQASALTGTCVDNIISPSHQVIPCQGCTAVTVGSDNYHELDASPDNCGDTSSTDNSAVFGAAAEGVTIIVNNFLCQAPAGQTGTPHLVLPNCTSWQVPGKTLLCTSSAPNYPYNTNAIPGSPSKCNCGTIDLPIQPVTPTVQAAKACNTAKTNTPNPPTFDFSGTSPVANPTICDAGVEGGAVTYTVAVKNTSQFGSIAVDQVCDSAYGNIFTASGFTGTPCAAGTQCAAPNNVVGTGCATSTTCGTLTSIAQGSVGTCTFTTSVGELASVSNVANVAGHSNVSTSQHFGPSPTNSVMVTSSEAPSSAEVTPGWVQNTNACVTVRYNVTVQNTGGFDEKLYLTGLNDALGFGDLTSVHGNVLGTTCGVSTGSVGLGTLSGSNGAGSFASPGFPLNVGAAGSTGTFYSCQFDGQTCLPTSTLQLGAGATCNGIQNQVQVNASLTGDEGGETVTKTLHTLTVQECVDVHTSVQ